MEHLLPQSPSDEWYKNDQFENKADADKYIHKIGNTLFIFGKINKTIKNDSFSDKLTDSELISPKIGEQKVAKTLSDSKLFKEEMEWAFGEVPESWTKENINQRSDVITQYIIDNRILDPTLD